MQSDLFYQIAITQLEKIGPVHTRNLVSYCGGVQAVFESSKKALMKIPGIGPNLASKIREASALKKAEAEIRFIEKSGIQAYFYLDKDYPNRLKPFSNAPIMLYVKGKVNLNHPRTLAIVGTRQPSPRGLANCEALLEGVKMYNPLVISGLAYGVDVCAHRKCVELNISNVGVLGHGLGQIYPPKHRGVAERMKENGGLVTEFTSSTLPDREHFPMRNRIIAGLCDALVVIETDKKGGSMISARMANEYNRDVFAFPGRVGDLKSRGCNHLIKSHQAALIEDAKDIAYIMRWPEVDQPKIIQKHLFLELGVDEKYIVDLLGQKEEIGFDQLAYATGKTSSEMTSILLELEFKGLIKTLPGKRYMLVP